MTAPMNVPAGDRESTGIEPGGLRPSSLPPHRLMSSNGWLPVLIALLGVGLTVWGMSLTYDHAHENDRQHFESLADRLKNELSQRLGVYRTGLAGLRTLYAASTSVQRSEFHVAMAMHDMRSEFPGALGVGYVRYVQRADVESFLAETRADGAPNFQLKTGGDHPDLMVIEFIEPLADNRAAEGFDIGQNVERRAAAERAMRTGEAWLTSKITLVQARNSGPGFLYFLPVYRGGVSLETFAQREAHIKGWLYMPILAERLFKGAGATTDDELDFAVYEQEPATPESLIFDGGGKPQSRAPNAAPSADGGAFERITQLQIGGHNWVVTMRASRAFHRESLAVVWAVLVAGSALSLLLGLLLRAQISAATRAHSLARAMTADVHRLALVAQHSTNGVLICDAQQRITWVNRGFTRITGHAAKDLIGGHLMETVANEQLERGTGRRLDIALTAGQAFRGELARRGKSGAISWLQADIQPLRDERGALNGFVSVETDVTEDTRAKTALQDSQNKLEAALVALEDAQSMGRLGSWSIDPSSWRMEWSKQLFALFELSPKAGAPDFAAWQALFVPADAARHELLVKQSATAGTSYNCVLARASSGNGVRHLRVEGRARREAVRVGSIYGTVIDVTGEIEREETLKQAQRRAEDASRSKSEFLANMSHEIRTPMTAILGFAELLADDGPSRPTSEQRQEYSATIKRNGEHLLSIINDILDISKIEAGMLKTERIEMELQKLLDDVIPMMTVTAHSKSLSLKYAARTPLPVTVKTDPVRLRQILINLIGNAVKFTETGSVSITASFEPSSTPPTLRFDITDTGIGLTPEQGQRIFGAFQQADSSTTRKFGGTGLGLQISKRLAQILGGDISFTSEYGRGSTFSVAIDAGVPIRHAMTASTRMRTQPLAPRPRAGGLADAPLQGARILLAEDGLDNQRLIAFHLRKAGAQVQIVDNGKSAVEALCADGSLMGELTVPSPIDVILTDMQMPIMDGYAAARLLRQKGCTLPIIALTAHAMSGDVEKCLDAGCDGYAAKPIDRTQLVEICVKALAGELWAPDTQGRKHAVS